MIEIIIKIFLGEKLDVPVFLEYPLEDKPDAFVLFEKVGSGKNKRLPDSTLAFQSYAPSLYEAAKLNDKVKEAVEELILLDEISAVNLNSDYNFTDRQLKEYRYQAVFDIYHY